MAPSWKDEPTNTRRITVEAARIPAGEGLKKLSYLLTISGGSLGRRYRLGKEATLGRDPSATIPVEALDVSRRHARIEQSSEGAFVLQDLGSSNGTLVNGLRAELATLRAGDVVQLGGETAFLFVQYSALEDLVFQEQRLESIGRLAGGLAHEFNNLLAVVLADVDYLRSSIQRGVPSQEEALDCIKNVENAARRAVHLTRQMLGYTRRGPGEIQSVELHSLVEEVVSLLRPTLSENVTLRTEVPTELAVLGDPAQLQQALINLCMNAAQAMAEGGAIAVRAEAVSQTGRHPSVVATEQVLITVQDTGPGMDQETREKIFEPFFNSRGAEGSGFGLATVYGIVKHHRGQVEVESEPGWGTSFKLYLPAARQVGSDTAEKITAPSSAAVSKGVLLVEDVEAERRLAARILEGMGLKVLEAADGRQAIRIFMANRAQVQLVVLDLILPGVTGKETFRWLRKLDGQLKVILTSGYLDESRVRDLLDAGAFGYLPKPYQHESLRSAVERALSGGEEAVF